MKTNFVGMVGVVLFLVGGLGIGEARADTCAADMPSPWDTAGCEHTNGNVCEYTANKIECYGTVGKDVMMIISSNNDPIAYGILDVGGGDYAFCCDVADMDDDTWPLYIQLYAGNNELCLNDDNHGWCNNVLGANPWPANSTILAGSGNDKIDTAYGGGAYTDAVELGAGNDVAYTWDGDDYVLGEAGDDAIYLGDGDDIADGGPDTDSLYGNADDDILLGGTGGAVAGTPDYLDGGPGTDCLCGGEWGLNLNDDGGYDTMVGGLGASDKCYWWDGNLDIFNTEIDNESRTCSCP